MSVCQGCPSRATCKGSPNMTKKWHELWLKYHTNQNTFIIINPVVPKGPSINVNIFTSLQTIHFRGEGGLWKSNFFWYTFNFWSWFFIILIGIFGTQKMVMCTLFWGEGVSESVWFVHSWKCRHLWTAPYVSSVNYQNMMALCNRNCGKYHPWKLYTDTNMIKLFTEFYT